MLTSDEDEYEELRQLAGLALNNAFYTDFSALVTAYLSAAEGLDQDTQKYRIADLANVYSVDPEAVSDSADINLWTKDNDGLSTGHSTIMDALAFESALEVHLNGAKVFEKHSGGWRFVG